MNPPTEIDTSQYLYLTHIGEPRDNSLRLVIAEAQVDRANQDDSISAKIVSTYNAILSNSECRVWEVAFDNYVAYSVRNEAFTMHDNLDQYVGRLFRIYSKSKFLDYVRASTIASEDYPGPMHHYGLNCLNHLVDIVAVKHPVIHLLSS